MTDLLDPADAANFRMTIDWGRWYIDPLPTCEIADATESRWPSYSTVKKAADKDWSFLTVNRLAGLASPELRRIAELDATQRADAVRSHEKLAKQIAFGRGTIVHLWAEDLAAGLAPRVIDDGWLVANGYPAAARDEAEQYRSALCDFFQTYQPERVAAEYVTIHRTLNGYGYGATPDGLMRIQGELVAVDWKSRSANSSHAAYPEEAAQIAAGVRAEYMVTRAGGQAERRLIPEVTGGYVVSIKPDSARLYPIDIDKAWEHFSHLHEWWTHRLDEKAAIGRVRPFRTSTAGPSEPCTAASTTASEPTPLVVPDEGSSPASASSPSPDRREQLLARYVQLAVADQERFIALGVNKDDLDAIEKALDDIDPFVGGAPAPSTPEPTPTVETPILAPLDDEGADVDGYEFDALERDFSALDTEAQLWMSTVIAEGMRAGVAFHANKSTGRRTERRLQLYVGLMALGASGNGNDDMVREIVATVLDTDAAFFPSLTCGYVVGSLDAANATTFARLCVSVSEDPVSVELRCRPAA